MNRKAGHALRTAANKKNKQTFKEEEDQSLSVAEVQQLCSDPLMAEPDEVSSARAARPLDAGPEHDALEDSNVDLFASFDDLLAQEEENMARKRPAVDESKQNDPPGTHEEFLEYERLKRRKGK